MPVIKTPNLGIATPERNHWLGTATESLPPHEAPRFGRLRLPQLGAGVSRVTAPLTNEALPDARAPGARVINYDLRSL